jgi:ribosomal protein S27AE
MSSSQIHEGYVVFDHRASPGIPGDPLKGEGSYFEAKTNHCSHCGTVVILNPLRTRERTYCSKCNKYVCDNCGISMKLSDYVHKTYKQSLEEIYNNGQKNLLNL